MEGAAEILEPIMEKELMAKGMALIILSLPAIFVHGKTDL